MTREVVYIRREEAGLWRERATCRGSYGTHFPTASVGQAQRREQVRAAVAMCKVCPVRQECFDLATKNKEKDGIWGGVEFS